MVFKLCWWCVTAVNSNVSSANYTFSGLLTDASIWVEFENEACLTSRSRLTGFYGGAIASPTVINGSACTTTPSSITLTANSTISGTFTWYSTSVGGSALSVSGSNVTTSAFATPLISVTSPFFVEFSNGACVSTRKRVEAYLINASLITAATVNACAASTVPSTYTNGILSASSPLAGQFRWFNSSTGGTALVTSAPSVTGSNYNITSVGITGSISAFTVTELLDIGFRCQFLHVTPLVYLLILISLLPQLYLQ